jgi:hypothetical protein
MLLIKKILRRIGAKKTSLHYVGEPDENRRSAKSTGN